MSQFGRIKEASVATRQQNEIAVHNLLAIAEVLPFVGPVAKLLNSVIKICDQPKCNKYAFEHLKSRLYKFTHLLFSDDGLVAVAKARSKHDILQAFLLKMEDTINDAMGPLRSFSRRGFLSSLMQGSVPRQTFNDLDAHLTTCLNDLSLALQVASLNEQAQTYAVVCNIESKIGEYGGLQGVSDDREVLQRLAQEIDCTVEDLRQELADSLQHIDSIVQQIDSNVLVVNGASTSTNASSDVLGSGPTTPQPTAETAMEELSGWFTSACHMLPGDSAGLAHSLVTVKCVNSVEALGGLIDANPSLLTQELKVAASYDLQIKRALRQQKMNLQDLTVDQVCILLDHYQMSNIKPIAQTKQVSGILFFFFFLAHYNFLFSCADVD
jgi:hypothetical protein